MNEPLEKQVEWTPVRVAIIVMMLIIGGTLVWNATIPGDIFFSDLKYERPIADRIQPQNDTNTQGNTIAIGKTYYPRGIGVHANSELFCKYIPIGYTYFTAEIGIDCEVPSDEPSSVIFTVIADGTLLYESPVLKQGMLPRLVRIPILGRKQIILKVSDAGDGNQGDHANWAMARFTAR